jgi:hypothetical protein
VERKARLREAAASAGSAFFYLGGKQGRAEREGEEESSSLSAWKGTGVPATQGAENQDDGAKNRVEQLRASQRTSRHREDLREEEPTCGSKMYPTQLEMRSKLQFHSGMMRGASN